MTGSYQVPGFSGGSMTTPYRRHYPTQHEAVAAAAEFVLARNSLPGDSDSAAKPAHKAAARKIREFLTEQSKPEAWGEEGAAPADPAATIEEAAEETDPNPTEAQKEAENYKTGKTQWNGLTLSIENKKGTERSKTGPNGKEWSVTMPAHYGRILRTVGADGDHVDFYMGEVEDSDAVLIVNQVDPETLSFDEHKVVLGTTARGAALDIYRAGFSDGSGDRRIGSFSETTVAGLKNWLAEGDLKKPTQPISMPFVNTKAQDDGRQSRGRCRCQGRGKEGQEAG